MYLSLKFERLTCLHNYNVISVCTDKKQRTNEVNKYKNNDKFYTKRYVCIMGMLFVCHIDISELFISTYKLCCSYHCTYLLVVKSLLL